MDSSFLPDMIKYSAVVALLNIDNKNITSIGISGL